MVDIQSYFPQIGSTGDKPADGKDWNPGDNYFAAHLTYLWDQVRKRFGDVENRLNAIDSNDDGVVDEADYAQDADASTYKGNDIDSDGDGIVDQADSAGNADNLGGNSPSYYATSAEYDDHVGDTTNPHSITASQVGAPSNSEFDSHTSAIDNPHNVTVSQLDVYSTSNTYSISQADSNFSASGHSHSQLHDKYTDSEARSAVSGATLSGGLTLGGNFNTSGTINADGNAGMKAEVRNDDPSNPDVGQMWVVQ